MRTIPSVAYSSNSQDSSIQLIAQPDTPRLPEGLGCYVHPNATSAWLFAPCLPSETQVNLRPNEGGGSNGVAIYGGDATNSTEISYSSITVEMEGTYSGETDSSWGNDSFSIQLNTNAFTGSNGDQYAVQATEQSSPNSPGIAQVCIWEVDITTQSYPNACTDTSTQMLSANYEGEVTLNIASNGDLGTEFCNVSNEECWGVVTGDNISLGSSGNWIQSSGAMLGVGGSSEAEFTSPTSMASLISMYDGSGLDESLGSSTLTDESNNLSYQASTVDAYCTSSTVCYVAADSDN